MKFSGSYLLPAPREKVFAAITNPEVLQRIIDGCEKIVRTGDNSYDAYLKIGLGGLKGTYIGKVLLNDLVPPESYTLQIEGKGGPGHVKGSAHVRLNDRGQETDLRCDSDAQVGGLIAAVGSRFIEAAAKKMMDEFFRKLGEELKKN